MSDGDDHDEKRARQNARARERYRTDDDFRNARNARARERYHNDPDYRQRVIERARIYQAKTPEQRRDAAQERYRTTAAIRAAAAARYRRWRESHAEEHRAKSRECMRRYLSKPEKAEANRQRARRWREEHPDRARATEAKRYEKRRAAKTPKDDRGPE